MSSVSPDLCAYSEHLFGSVFPSKLHAASPPPPQSPPLRRASAPEDRAAKEALILAHQQEHYREMRDAAKRNKLAVMAELAGADSPEKYQEQQLQQQLSRQQLQAQRQNPTPVPAPPLQRLSPRAAAAAADADTAARRKIPLARAAQGVYQTCSNVDLDR